MRGRTRKVDRPTEWKISLPSSLAHAFTQHLRDPLTKKIPHGARSQLIVRLLRQHLERRLPKATEDLSLIKLLTLPAGSRITAPNGSQWLKTERADDWVNLTTGQYLPSKLLARPDD